MCKLFDCCKLFASGMRKHRCDAYLLRKTFTSARIAWNEWRMKKRVGSQCANDKCKTKDKHSDANLINAKCGAHRSFCSSFFFRSLFFFSSIFCANLVGGANSMRKKLNHNSIWIKWLSVWNALLPFHLLHKSSCTNFSELLLAINGVWLNGAAICKCEERK